MAGTYDSLRDRQPQDRVTATEFLAVTVFATVLTSAIAGGAAYVYVQAITPGGRSRYDREAGEVDATGELIR